MKLAIPMIVHSAVKDTFQTTASVNGKNMPVTVEGVVIELVTEDGSMSMTIRDIVDSPDDTLAAFEAGKGATVNVTPDK